MENKKGDESKRSAIQVARPIAVTAGGQLGQYRPTDEVCLRH